MAPAQGKAFRQTLYVPPWEAGAKAAAPATKEARTASFMVVDFGLADESKLGFMESKQAYAVESYHERG